MQRQTAVDFPVEKATAPSTRTTPEHWVQPPTLGERPRRHPLTFPAFEVRPLDYGNGPPHPAAVRLLAERLLRPQIDDLHLDDRVPGSPVPPSLLARGLTLGGHNRELLREHPKHADYWRARPMDLPGWDWPRLSVVILRYARWLVPARSLTTSAYRLHS